MAVFVNPRDQLLQATVPRVTPIPIDPNSIPGLPGAIAATKGVRIRAPSTVFQIAQNGTPSPSSITMNAVLTNVTGTVVWSIVSGNAVLTGTGNSRTLAAGDMLTSSVTVRAKVVYENSEYIDDYTIVKVLDGLNGTGGTPGSNTSLVYAYMRSATAPSTNPGAVVWTFNVAAITTPATLPNGWSKSIPAGTLPIYVTVATANSTTNTDTIAANEWTAPVVLGSQGTNGLNSATVWLFARSFSTTAPAAPAADLTYNFTTGLLAGSLGIWSQSVPLTSGSLLYVTTATAASTSNTDTIAPTDWAAPWVLAKDGVDGDDGVRGSLDLVATASGLDSYPTRAGGLAQWSIGTPSVANATAADNFARTLIWTALGNSGTPTNNSHLRLGDKVVLKNDDQSRVGTGYWGGSGWMHPGLILDGNLLVPGTVTATKIDARGLTIRMPDGTIVLDASRRLQRADLTDLGVLAALNSVALGTSQVTGTLPTSNITGLGALALLNSVNLNTQTTGALNGLTQVTNLGGLAYANAIAAEQIGAGAINAGHISAGAVTANAIAAGAITADKINVGLASNKIPNTEFVTLAGWDFYQHQQTNSYMVVDGGGLDWRPPGGHVLTIVQPNNWYVGSDTLVSQAHIDVPVDFTKRYVAVICSGAHRCRSQLDMELYGPSGWTGSDEYVGDTINDGVQIGGQSLANYKRHYVFFKPSPGTTYIRFCLKKFSTKAGFSDSAVFFTQPILAEAAVGQTALPTYTPAGVGTLITPAGISTPNLSSISAVIGLLRTSASGQRSEIDDNGHRGYDVNNVMRARLGVW